MATWLLLTSQTCQDSQILQCTALGCSVTAQALDDAKLAAVVHTHSYSHTCPAMQVLPF